MQLGVTQHQLASWLPLGREIEQRTERQKSERSTMYGRSHDETKASAPSSQQFFENVVPIHVLIAGMARDAGFQLQHYEQDVDTDCGEAGPGVPAGRHAPKCAWKGRHGAHAKYVHLLFRRVEDEQLFAGTK